MRRFVATVFDEWVYTTTAYTSDVFLDLLGSVDRLAIQAIVEAVSNGGSGADVFFNLVIESTSDGDHWFEDHTPIQSGALALDGPNVLMGYVDDTSTLMGRVRLKISLTGVTQHARVRIVVCGRDRTSESGEWRASMAQTTEDLDAMTRALARDPSASHQSRLNSTERVARPGCASDDLECSCNGPSGGKSEGRCTSKTSQSEACCGFESSSPGSCGSGSVFDANAGIAHSGDEASGIGPTAPRFEPALVNTVLSLVGFDPSAIDHAVLSQLLPEYHALQSSTGEILSLPYYLSIVDADALACFLTCPNNPSYPARFECCKSYKLFGFSPQPIVTSSCVDKYTNLLHCGACGNPCDWWWETCVGGKCLPLCKDSGDCAPDAFCRYNSMSSVIGGCDKLGCDEQSDCTLISAMGPKHKGKCCPIAGYCIDEYTAKNCGGSCGSGGDAPQNWVAKCEGTSGCKAVACCIFDGYSSPTHVEYLDPLGDPIDQFLFCSCLLDPNYTLLELVTVEPFPVYQLCDQYLDAYP